MFGIDESKAITFAADGEPAGSVVVWETKAQFAVVVTRQNWSKADVTAIWNANVGRGGFNGAVKRFRNRPYGVDQIWKAMQPLKAEGADELPPANGKPRTPRGDSRRETFIELLRRDGGVSGAELQKQFNWQPHSARGFLSTLASKHGVRIEASKDESRGRVYRAV
jgi:hypothetical protein